MQPSTGGGMKTSIHDIRLAVEDSLQSLQSRQRQIRLQRLEAGRIAA